MKTLVPSLLALLISLPAAAQNRFFDLTGSYVWADPTGGGEFEDLADPAEIEFDASTGYGASVNFFISDRLSIDIGASVISPETRIRRRAIGAGGDVQIDMIPITGILQFHLAPNSFVDPYIGGGAAYVLFDDINETGLDDLDRIDFKEDVGFVVNAGVGIRLGNRFGIVLDGKYVPIETDATAVNLGATEEADTRVDISPIILSAGLQLRF
ncbi:MAG TPA: OmpW family outer membrane protein [Thermoanaerobaculia bacterium]|jgi:outer membrane protein W|nr:OmpW family outer membrane protein [Thermoanaerobaculia bacterium]